MSIVRKKTIPKKLLKNLIKMFDDRAIAESFYKIKLREC